MVTAFWTVQQTPAPAAAALLAVLAVAVARVVALALAADHPVIVPRLEPRVYQPAVVRAVEQIAEQEAGQAVTGATLLPVVSMNTLLTIPHGPPHKLMLMVMKT